jgi:uncharacterized protein (TIGR02147 family)
MKTLFSYHSYRPYLRDTYENEKRVSKGLTLTVFAQRLGLSASTFNMVLAGTRNLTVGNLHLIARELNLSSREHEYFESLVLMEQADDPQTRQYYSRKLKTISKTARTKGLRVSDKRLLSSWLTPALLIYLIDIERINHPEKLATLDLEKLAKQFSLRPEQVRSLLSAIEDSGLLSVDAEEKVHIVFDKVNHHLPQKQYVQSVLAELARRIETEFESKQTLFRGYVFSVDREQLPGLKKELQDLFEKYMAKVSKKPEKNTLIQGLIGLFPILPERNHKL